MTFASEESVRTERLRILTFWDAVVCILFVKPACEPVSVPRINDPMYTPTFYKHVPPQAHARAQHHRRDYWRGLTFYSSSWFNDPQLNYLNLL